MTIENPLIFYPRYGWETVSIFGRAAAKLAKLWRFARNVQRDPNARNYTDEALRTSDDYDHQEMYQLTEAARQAGAKAKRLEEHKHARAPVAETVEAVK